MRSRAAALAVALVVSMAGFGYGVYRGLGHFKHTDSVGAVAEKPLTEHATVDLPGTIYLAQDGDLYGLHARTFTKVLDHTEKGGWTQPSVTLDGRLLAVLRGPQSSDLYVVDRQGHVAGRLTADDAGKRRSDGSLEYDRWAFYPRATTDGGALVFSYDSPKRGYETALAVWTMPLPPPGAAIAAPSPPAISADYPPTSGPPGSRRLTTPFAYSGGDVMPQPLPGGGLVLVRYSFDDQYHIHSQLWYKRNPGDAGLGLTAPAEDCSQPSLAGDGVSLAMVCSHGEQTGALEVATLTTAAATAPPGTAEAALTAPRTLLAGSLVAFPTWAPDGSGLVYLAPTQSGAHFQLWWLAGAATATPKPSVEVTAKVGLDATSPPAWTAG